MGPRQHEDFDAVDACIFSGDVLWTDLAGVKKWLDRWNRAVAKHEEALAAEATNPTPDLEEG
jgi:hypothetical protein